MAKKKDPIAEAKALLTASGYTVTRKRPDPEIGDVVRIYDKSGDSDVLITFHQTDSAGPTDHYHFGGVIVARDTHDVLYTDTMWIDSVEWAKDDGQYAVIGHVDLSKYITRA